LLLWEGGDDICSLCQLRDSLYSYKGRHISMLWRRPRDNQMHDVRDAGAYARTRLTAL
jgi:hypothetical protein